MTPGRVRLGRILRFLLTVVLAYFLIGVALLALAITAVLAVYDLGWIGG